VTEADPCRFADGPHIGPATFEFYIPPPRVVRSGERAHDESLAGEFVPVAGRRMFGVSWEDVRRPDPLLIAALILLVAGWLLALPDNWVGGVLGVPLVCLSCTCFGAPPPGSAMPFTFRWRWIAIVYGGAALAFAVRTWELFG
jgi:hypothetical protein